jgi:hypothetical protein
VNQEEQPPAADSPSSVQAPEQRQESAQELTEAPMQTQVPASTASDQGSGAASTSRLRPPVRNNYYYPVLSCKIKYTTEYPL